MKRDKKHTLTDILIGEENDIPIKLTYDFSSFNSMVLKMFCNGVCDATAFVGRDALWMDDENTMGWGRPTISFSLYQDPKGMSLFDLKNLEQFTLIATTILEQIDHLWSVHASTALKGILEDALPDIISVDNFR